MKLLFAVVLVLGCATASPVAAASPALTLQCGAPSGASVTCRLSGRGFHASERLYVFYVVAITAGGTTTARTYSRSARTGSGGRFQRPPLRVFGGHHGLFSYRVTSIVVGSRGDRASTEAAGQP